MIDNGSRLHMVIAGVFDGIAGVQGNTVAFRPNRSAARPGTVKGGILDGKPVRFLQMTKDKVGPFWTARFEAIE